MDHIALGRVSERGSASAKFMIFLVIVGILAHAGYNYVPIAYDAESMRTDMQTAVMQGLALPGKTNAVDNVKQRIQKAAASNALPADTVIEVKQNGNVITAHVAYSKEVNILPFGMYRYNYQFDHTATPTGFLLKQ